MATLTCDMQNNMMRECTVSKKEICGLPLTLEHKTEGMEGKKIKPINKAIVITLLRSNKFLLQTTISGHKVTRVELGGESKLAVQRWGIAMYINKRTQITQSRRSKLQQTKSLLSTNHGGWKNSWRIDQRKLTLAVELVLEYLKLNYEYIL